MGEKISDWRRIKNIFDYVVERDFLNDPRIFPTLIQRSHRIKYEGGNYEILKRSAIGMFGCWSARPSKMIRLARQSDANQVILLSVLTVSRLAYFSYLTRTPRRRNLTKLLWRTSTMCKKRKTRWWVTEIAISTKYRGNHFPRWPKKWWVISALYYEIIYLYPLCCVSLTSAR